MRASAGLIAAAVAAIATVLGGSSALAQSVTVDLDRNAQYLGDPISIRVTASNFEADPTPQIASPPPVSGQLEFLGVSPSVSQSIAIRNGQMTRTREVTHVFQFRFIGTAPGRATVGPFRVTQGKTVVGAPAVHIDVQDVPSNDDLAVRVKLPDGAVFVGERVPVTVEFELEQKLGDNLLSYELNVPIFDHRDAFRFLANGADGSQDIVLQTANGRVNVKGATNETRRGGKTFTVISFERTIVPLVAGVFDLAPATLSILEATAWQRDFFGGRRATQQRRWGAKDLPRRLEVLEIPGGERPATFAGAIGSGFTFDVAIDRSVVQVGDPITLTLTLRGEGVETAGMPRLDSEGLLPPADFRVPEADLTGELVGDAKQFVATVRVLSDGTREIPALSYSWFDPESQKYEVTQSHPIALSVRSALVIGAADVQSSVVADARAEREAGAAEHEPGAAEEAAEGAATGTPSPRAFELFGADLAIEREVDRLLAGDRGIVGSAWLVGSLYALGVVCIPVALWDRRRRDVDPALALRRSVVAAERARIETASALPPGEAATSIAASLRRMLAHAPEAGSAALDALLGECDARSYAPAGQARALDPDLVARAIALARGIEEALG